MAAAVVGEVTGAEVAAVRSIVTEEVAAFLAARRQASVTPTVVALREIAAGLVDYDVIAQDDIVEEEPLFAAFEEEANEPL